VGVNLAMAAPSQPLAFDPRLIESARLHSQDMHDRLYFEHNTPDGVTPTMRIQNAAFPATAEAESIHLGSGTAAGALADLIVDNGVPSLGHRIQLLALDSYTQQFRLVGVGAVLDPTLGTTTEGYTTYQNYWTIDEAAQNDPSYYLTGSVFHD